MRKLISFITIVLVTLTIPLSAATPENKLGASSVETRENMIEWMNMQMTFAEFSTDKGDYYAGSVYVRSKRYNIPLAEVGTSESKLLDIIVKCQNQQMKNGAAIEKYQALGSMHTFVPDPKKLQEYRRIAFDLLQCSRESTTQGSILVDNLRTLIATANLRLEAIDPINPATEGELAGISLRSYKMRATFALALLRYTKKICPDAPPNEALVKEIMLCAMQGPFALEDIKTNKEELTLPLSIITLKQKE